MQLSKQRDVEKVHTTPINSLDLDPVEMRYLISGASNGTIAIHDLHNVTGQPQYTCPLLCTVDRCSQHAHKYSVETVQWYPADSGMFVSSSFDKTLKVWDTNTLVPVETVACRERVYCHRLSKIATKHCLIAVASSLSQVNLVDLKSGSYSHILKGHKGAVYVVDWSPQNEYVLASGSSDNKALMWDVRMAKNCIFTLDQHNGDATRCGPHAVQTAHNGAVNGLRFTADGLYLVSFGTDCRVRLWRTDNGQNMLVNYGAINNVHEKCLSIDVSSSLNPEIVFVPHDSNIDMLCLHTGTKLQRLVGHYNDCNTLVYHPFHQELYSGGNDRNIIAWLPKTASSDDYQEHLKETKLKKGTSRETKKKGANVNLMQDTWSSDED
ncbi:PREDICTED: DNA excision repair protein ERCC-8-like isoform X2 [Priapulus caudatus]|nr:PREDICTED: DNA excision repair protein ERCC-8-like isoform X2 [Priapulus caudatus]